MNAEMCLQICWIPEISEKLCDITPLFSAMQLKGTFAEITLQFKYQIIQKK